MFDLAPFKFSNMENSLFPDFFSDDFFEKHMLGFKTDIIDNGNEYVIEAELPGFAKEEITVETINDRLTISATHNESNEAKNGEYIRKERRSGQVTRSFSLEGIKQDEIYAEFKNGVLKLNLPKVNEEAPKSRRIGIN